jgi:hypothetical protein|tara:strand:- start:552 stop:731 length:180 start_codon:yes stop_codon:yes gene_type:complete
VGKSGRAAQQRHDKERTRLLGAPREGVRELFYHCQFTLRLLLLYRRNIGEEAACDRRWS